MNDVNVKYRVYDTLTSVPLDESAWDRLVARSETGGVFLQHAWIHTWWRYFGNHYELFFVTAEVDHQVVAFAPMMIDEKRTLRFIGDLNSDYLDLVIPPEHGNLLAGFIDFLSNTRDQWQVIHLRNIPRHFQDISSLMTLSGQNRLFPWNHYSEAAPYLQIADNDDGIRTLLAKYSLRRSNRQIQKQGDVRFEVFDTNERAACNWELFARQHIRRCNRAGRSSPFSNPEYLSFLRFLYETDSCKSRVHFSGLFLNERPIAFHLGFVSRNRLLWYKPSFDIELRKGSPGIVLICHLIQYAQEHGIEELDFTIGEEPFKDRFCNEKRMIDSFRIYKSRRKYLLESCYWAFRHRLKLLVKMDRS